MLFATTLWILLTASVWFFSRREFRTMNLAFMGLVGFVVLVAAGCGQWGAAFNLLDEADAVALGIIPFIAALGSAVLPADSVAISAAATALGSSLQALRQLLQGYKENPSESLLKNISAAVDDAIGNTQQIETIGGIKSTRAKNILSAAMATIRAVLSSLILNLHGSPSADVSKDS